MVSIVIDIFYNKGELYQIKDKLTILHNLLYFNM